MAELVHFAPVADNPYAAAIVSELQQNFPHIPIKVLGNEAVTDDEIAQGLQNAEILFMLLNPFKKTRILQKLPKLKWLQLPSAGMEWLLQYHLDSEQPFNAMVTRTVSVWSVAVAEGVIGRIFEHEKQFLTMYDHQKAGEYPGWRPHRRVETSKALPRLLSRVSVGILGLGNIGQEVAWRAKALGMTVWALVRELPASPHHFVDKYVLLDDLSLLLSSCDYIVKVLPGTPATRYLLSGDMFAHCAQKKAVFINVGRGDIADEKSIVNALDQGWLSKAILDVFEVEPLPSTSPLWHHAGVVLSPHSLYSHQGSVQQICREFSENYARYVRGEPLANQADLQRGY